MAGQGKAKRTAARGARLRAALRENLKRRKAQARRRAAAAQDVEAAASPSEAERESGCGPDFRRNPGRE
jgi:hypothetical protein